VNASASRNFCGHSFQPSAGLASTLHARAVDAADVFLFGRQAAPMEGRRLFPDSSWHLRDFSMSPLTFFGRRGKSFPELSHLLPFLFFPDVPAFSRRLAPLSGNYNRLMVCGLTVARYFMEELYSSGFIVRGCCAASFHSEGETFLLTRLALLLMGCRRGRPGNHGPNGARAWIGMRSSWPMT